MNKGGDIIIIEDDKDDQFIIEQAFEVLPYPNKRIFFQNGSEALEYLQRKDTQPFIIISDINMPVLNGFELREKLKQDSEISLKCIPYLFFSTAINQKTVIDAYSTSAQGFFAKPNSFEDLVETIRVIVDYWKKCASPNNF